MDAALGTDVSPPAVMGAHKRREANLPGGRDPWSLEPEVVLPEQFLAGADPLKAGEMRLLWAVFMDGITTYCLETLRAKTAGRRYREVERWIFGPDSDLFTSFRTLCELFRIDVRRLRCELWRFRQEPNRVFMDLIKPAAARARRRDRACTVLRRRRRKRARAAPPGPEGRGPRRVALASA